jgi:hypothetical protein
VQADEEVGLVVVGERRAVVVQHDAVVVSREQHADAEARIEHASQAARDVEHQVLLEHAAGPARALFLAAMPGIDHDRAQAWRLRAGIASAMTGVKAAPPPPVPAGDAGAPRKKGGGGGCGG